MKKGVQEKGGQDPLTPPPPGHVYDLELRFSEIMQYKVEKRIHFDRYINYNDALRPNILVVWGSLVRLELELFSSILLN